MQVLNEENKKFIQQCEHGPDLLDSDDTRKLLGIVRYLRTVASGQVTKHKQRRHISLLAALLIVSICAATPFVVKNCSDAQAEKTKIEAGEICTKIYPEIMKAAGKLREVCK